MNCWTMKSARPRCAPIRIDRTQTHGICFPPKEKPPRGGLSRQKNAIDQVASIMLLRRRYAMKPSPQKPRIIIAHVEGSGMLLILASGVLK